ncbi:MAG: protein-L-isoaspartate(D-aspartate) O-methyltransferase [Candidatus Omnitrophota bacterium]
MDYKLLRENMVRSQLIPRGIKDSSVLAAFGKVERHLFVPEEFLENAYGDHPLPIGSGQTISQPFMAALMTESLGLGGCEKVLEIGTGSGYQTAILAELVKKVYSLERVSSLAEGAKTILSKLEYKNIDIDTRDGSLGWPEHAPYDAIIITASCPGRPATLLAQVKEGGRLIAPIGVAFGQILTLFTNKSGTIVENEICGCMFVPLIGKEGWNR